MVEIKELLDKLNSAYFELVDKIATLDKAIKDYDLKAKRLAEEKQDLNAKADALNQRENSVKHIESIDKAIQEAKQLREEAKLALDKATKKEEEYAEKMKQYNELKTQLDFDTDVNKKEGIALKKLKADLEKKEKQLRNAEAIIEAKE